MKTTDLSAFSLPPISFPVEGRNFAPAWLEEWPPHSACISHPGRTRREPPTYALLANGAAITAMAAMAGAIGELSAYWLHQNGLRMGLAENAGIFVAALTLGFTLRLSPIAGIHGAEHQVIHAIERELELTPSVIRRMPLIHPRCGTNFSMAAILFLVIFASEWNSSDILRLFTALAATLILWRPLGRLTQKYVTTKRPSDKQLDQAISAGNQLLERYSTSRSNVSNIGIRLWNSGIVATLLGASVVAVMIIATCQIFQHRWILKVD